MISPSPGRSDVANSSPVSPSLPFGFSDTRMPGRLTPRQSRPLIAKVHGHPPLASGRVASVGLADAPDAISPFGLILFGALCYQFAAVSGVVVIPMPTVTVIPSATRLHPAHQLDQRDVEATVGRPMASEPLAR